MKELKILGIVIVVLIVILISVTTVVENKIITDAGERGYSEGHVQGYKVGYAIGRVGYVIGRYEAGYNDGYKVGEIEGYESGHKIGFEKGIGAYYLVNPTYKEVQEILAEDETYSVEGINNNAEDKGIRAAYVAVSTPGGFQRRLVAFETIDKGLILIEPRITKIERWFVVVEERSHEEVKVEIGKSYSELNGFSPPDWDDTITKITIIW